MGKKVNTDLQNYDLRIISQRLLSGEISEKDLQSLLRKLPDVSENAEEVDITGNEK